PFSVPNDYTEDTWISFGADGVMDADVVTYSTPDGNVFNQSVITTAGTSAVDFRTGTTQEGSGTKPIHASDLASEFRSDLAGISAIVQPDAAAPTTTVDGHRAVRVMSTTAHGVDIDFFDANTYQILRSETRDGDANGPITMALDFLHYDVLQGQVAPTPIPFTPADAASPTTVPEGGATPPPDPGLAGG
ncbi:MAG TPA: hypothetical protein VIE40_03445, partial [Dehalococcoidia bacterium]